MDLTLFFGLEALGLLLVFLGYFSKERAYSLIGFSFLFVLGSWVILPGQLEIKTGETEAYTYLCYSCLGSSVPGLPGNETTISSIITTYNTTPWKDGNSKFFGIWQSVLAAVGFAISLIEVRRGTP